MPHQGRANRDERHARQFRGGPARREVLIDQQTVDLQLPDHGGQFAKHHEGVPLEGERMPIIQAAPKALKTRQSK